MEDTNSEVEVIKPKKAKAVPVVVEPQNTDVVAKEESSVNSFISKAIEMNAPVETLERLFALHKEAKAERAKEAYTEAMSRFQAECPVINKNKEVLNKDGKSVRYKYATIDSIVSQVKAILGKHGLSYTVDAVNEQNFVVAICKITHVLGHSENSSFRAPIDTGAYMSGPQIYASALTFAKRYAFCNALGIMTGDDDTDAASEEVKKEDKKVADVNEYKKLLEDTKTLPALQMVWGSLPPEAKKELEALKESLKKKYENPTV